MTIDFEENTSIQKVSTFNKLMINTVKDNENKFEFQGKNYSVFSDGVFVQTLINDRFLYRISIKEDNNSLVSQNLLNCI